MEIIFPGLEKKILRYWRENRIFEKSIAKRKKAKDFVFYEGPPTANAKPGLHHVLARIFKDIICRYKTMRGFRVERKAGWDTHGLPVELEIEKKLGLKSKKDIEKYGIAKFNQKCKESVWTYKRDWERLTERIAFWLDMKNPYITYTPNYIETVWWIIKEIFKRGLLYQDYKVVPYCPRCGTSLSSHEVALGYKKIKENSIYVKFKLKEYGARYFLVWTTTPWTLPANVALAVNPDIKYIEAYLDSNEIYILAEDRLEYLKKQFNIKNIDIKRKIKGKDLLGLEYDQLINFAKVDKPAFRVVAGSFVSTDEGTGVVHIAPAYGEDDMNLAKKENLPIMITVDEGGRFRKEIKPWVGRDVKEADGDIVQWLSDNGNLIKYTELYEHDYPFCWRCDSPLLYYAKESWFINMQKVKKDLIENNQKINWIPSHLKEGRFGEWLREVKDWAISRERYWGTPLPIWQCKKCQHLEVIGSKKDLLKQKFSTNRYFILRHGQNIYQTEKKEIIYSFPEKEPIKLTKKGEKEIKRVAQKLKKENIDLIFSSDITRCWQSAEIVSQELGGVKIVFDKRLRDVNLGIWHGRKKEEFYRDFPRDKEKFYKVPKGGEGWLECKKRMLNFIKEIDRKYQGKKILIVSHGDPLWLLEGAMKGLSNEEYFERGNKIIPKTGELRKLEFKIFPFNEKGEIDFHKPYIDEAKFYCQKCGDLMKRVPEVIDCWFDSGAMPFAQANFPFALPQNQKFLFPANYISEGVDQTRGWFYTLLAISTLLGFGPPYKNVISLGHLLDEKGEKMSKSKGNVVDSWYVVEKYGTDATRWYFYTVNQPGDSKLFSEQRVEQALKKFIMTLWNCYVFYNTYAEQRRTIRRTTQKNISVDQRLNQRKSAALLDKWIISKLNNLIEAATLMLDNYDVAGAARAIENFVIEDISLWYIRRSRRRFQRPETKKELKEASRILNYVLLTLSKLTAPFIPFLSEEIYQKLTTHNLQPTTYNSVHLEDWPRVNRKLIDKRLEEKMEKVREMVTLALAERTKLGMKVRQPLKELSIKNYELRKEKELLDLIKEEVNVKNIIFGKTLKLDTKITPELKEEGILREIIRQIQEMRKRAGLKPKDKILVRYSGSDDLNKILTKNKKFILKEAKVKNLILGEKLEETFDLEKEVKVDQEKLQLAIKKI